MLLVTIINIKYQVLVHKTETNVSISRGKYDYMGFNSANKFPLV